MRVLLASKALVRGAYQRKLETIAAQPDVDRLLAVVPPSWKEPGGSQLHLEIAHTRGYDLRVCPVRFNGNFHLFYWRGLGRVIRDFRPDVVHVDEEAYNFATVLATWQARRAGARPVFFTWQNQMRHYPPPFSAFERYVFSASRHAIVGNAEATDVLRAKGYRGPTSLIPQFGVDPDVFAPVARSQGQPPVIGFVARLVEEKGVWVLLQALERLPSPWHLHVVGSGPLLPALKQEVERRGWSSCVRWDLSVPSTQMADVLHQMDLLALPSLTRPNWKEQFGRALVEAMACGVPVIGSSSGEIPHVIGDAGLVVPENDPAALADAMARVLASPDEREILTRRGRQRVLQRFTHERIAEDTVRVYRQMLADA